MDFLVIVTIENSLLGGFSVYCDNDDDNKS